MSEESEAGPELDARIAKEVMGWRVEPLSNWPGAYPFRTNRSEQVRIVLWTKDADDPICQLIDETGASNGTLGPIEIPAFSTDIAAAWEVVLEGTPFGSLSWGIHRFHSSAGTDREWRADCGHIFAYAPTAQLAICRAALAAVKENSP